MYGFGTRKAAVRNRAVLLLDPEPTARDWLVASPATIAAYDPRDANTIQRPEGGKPTLPTHGVGTLSNLVGGGYDLAAPSSSQAPQWQSGALLFDGIDDLLAVDFPQGAIVNNLALLAIYRGTDTKGILFAGSQNGHVLGTFDNAGGSSSISYLAGTPSVFVNGQAVADSRSALSAALATGNALTVEVRNIDWSVWGRFGLGNSTINGWKVGGTFLPVALLNQGDADFAAALGHAREYAANIIAQVLP